MQASVVALLSMLGVCVVLGEEVDGSAGVGESVTSLGSDVGRDCEQLTRSRP